MKYYFIINPNAGKGKSAPALAADIEAYFAKNGDVAESRPYEIKYTEYTKHAIELARAFADRGELCRIYACGGDGTLNEVVAGAHMAEHVAIGCIPCGTGNDFIKAFGDAAEDRPDFRDVTAQIAGTVKEVDMIMCGDRVSVNALSMGLDANVAAGVYRYKRIVGGIWAYSLALVGAVLGRTRFPFEVTIDDGMHREVGEKYTLVLAGNGGEYGGGFKCAPGAVVDDGLLNFVVVQAVRKPQIATIVKRFKTGEHHRTTKITQYKGKKLEIVSPRVENVNADGEVFRTERLVAEIKEKGLRFIVPRG